MSWSHEEIIELLGAYALDAVEPHEAEVVEAHLAGCPRCAAEVAEHREVAAMLAHSGAPAPEGLWSRIVESLEETPPTMALPLPGPTDDARVVELGARRRRPARWLPLGAAAAAVLVVVGVVAGLLVAGDDGGAPDRSEDVALVELEDVARRVLNDPDATKVTLTAPDGRDLEAPAAIDDDGSGYLLASALPALDPTRTYQLWGVHGDVVVSLGVLGAKPGVVAFHADEGLQALVITEEVSGGVPSSSNPAFLVGELS
ncbi:MAG TPA: anti-sigma factor [Acidimicrobiales bacterium]|nr:anti-sigma factor [Acidimicrobiales bacterium]